MIDTVDRWLKARQDFKDYVPEYYRTRKALVKSPSNENAEKYREAQNRYRELIANMHALERELGYERVAKELTKMGKGQ